MTNDFLRFALMGADGETRWAFGRPHCPIRLDDVPEGLQGADFDLNYEQNVGQAGETYKGRVDKRNTIKMRVRVGDGRVGYDYRKLHARWRRSLGRGDELATFITVSAESGYRWKKVRLQSAIAAKGPRRTMPGEIGVGWEDVTLASDESFWTHPDRQMMWPANEVASATFRNPGDQPAWVRYTLTGPCEGYVLGLGTDRVRIGAIPSGGFVLIDTDPASPTAVNEKGEDLYEREYADFTIAEMLASWQAGRPVGPAAPMVFREALPAGGPNAAPIPLGVIAINPEPGATVLAEITPRSERAW